MKKKKKHRTKVKLSQIDIYVLQSGLESVKDACNSNDVLTELLWCKDYVNDLLHRLGKHLNDFDGKRR